MNDKVVIAFATDHNFRYYTGVALFSLMEHASPDTRYEILILSVSLSEADSRIFYQLVEGKKNFSLRFVDVSEKIRGIDITKLHSGTYGIAVLYRLFMHELLPEYDRILYLDSDIIVQADVKELFEADLKGAPIGAVKDCHATESPITAWPFQEYFRKRVNLKNPRNYFNSGVLLLDTDQLRKTDFPQKLCRELNCGIQFSLPDQDILNRIFEDEVCYFDESWNFMIPPDRNASRAKIVHFAGIHPWYSKSLPQADLWWKTAGKTFWAEDMNKELADPAIRIRYLEEIEKRYYEICKSTCWRATAFIRFTVNMVKWIKYLLKKCQLTGNEYEI